MPDFSKRSRKKELLDQDNIPFAHLQRNLLELDVINTWLGGHAVTIAGLKLLITEPHKTYTVLDIGSGGGDTLRFIARWATKKHLKLRLIGLDYKQEAIDYAAQQSAAYPTISFVLADYKALGELDFQPDIIISSLFCHHLNEEQLTDYLQLIYTHARIGYVINDLHRHPLAYYSIQWLSRLFSSSYLLKNDAPLSVLRGFSRKDWEACFEAVAVFPDMFSWKWAFRWLIVGRKVAG